MKLRIKKILERSMNANHRDWQQILNDTLWDYFMSFKMLIGMSPYQLFFGKVCDFPIELEHNASWALKKLNLSQCEAADFRLEQLNEIDEFQFQDYDRAYLYKERMKFYHDRRIEKIV